MKTKYYLIEWPECQKWLDVTGCIRIDACSELISNTEVRDIDTPIMAVPCELYDNEIIIINH